MTQDEIISMAREADAGYIPRYDMWQMDGETLERFAAIVAAHEREACAKVCEGLGRESGSDHEAGGMFECAAAIRERSNANARARSEK